MCDFVNSALQKDSNFVFVWLSLFLHHKRYTKQRKTHHEPQK